MKHEIDPSKIFSQSDLARLDQHAKAMGVTTSELIEAAVKQSIWSNPVAHHINSPRPALRMSLPRRSKRQLTPA